MTPPEIAQGCPALPAGWTIRDALGLLVQPASVVELRALGTRRGTVSGYFDNLDAMAEEAERWSGHAEGVFFTLNPSNLALIARARNRVREYARQTTGDADVLRRVWLMLDLDPVRPAGISSTDAEHLAALERAQEIRAWLRGEGWTRSILADSGNGAHLLYQVDLPNDRAARDLIDRCLKAVSFRFSDGTVTVDETTSNAARLARVPGTLNAKGDSTPDRPHRVARILDAEGLPAW
jgi:hypothetical protein